ncbi:MAG: pro-sigmaK processing inhibitor BofA [Clostridiaceae bacterium]|nr:pro-sigmaK processing inhibitor BofA [Clostridiaceae bacterium]
MYVEYSVIMAFVLGIIILFFLGKFLIVPLKLLINLLYKVLFGGIVISVINLLGGFFHFNIALNPLTALLAGVLGMPGIITLIVIKFLLGI